MTESSQLIQTFDDFRWHTILHRQRVLQLGLALWQKVPASFDQISERLVYHFLCWHDQAKFLPMKSAGKDSAQNATYLERLYSFYGRSTLWPSQEKNHHRSLIAELNQREDELAQKFFQKWGGEAQQEVLNDQASLQLQKLERVADLVDRGLCPVAREEFGHTMTLASQYLTDPDEQKLCLKLEDHYWTITGAYHAFVESA